MAHRLGSCCAGAGKRRAAARHNPSTWKHLFVDRCMACELSDGRSQLPGGLIHRTRHWRVEHCVGPLGLGTLIVKPERHVTAVDALTPDEALELGPLLRLTSAV